MAQQLHSRESATSPSAEPLWFMMKYWLNILLIVLGGICSAQEVVKSNLSSCDHNSYPEYIRDRLIEKEIKDDTLLLNVGLVLNCCVSPNPKLVYRSDTLFLSINDESDIWCACECCFEIQIKAIGITDTNFTLIHQFKKSDFTKEWNVFKELKPYKNKYIFPTPKEIESFIEFNRTTNDGLKIGLWNIYSDGSEKVKYKAYYTIDSDGKSVLIWSTRYDEQDEIVEICAKTGVNESTCAEGPVYYKLMNDKP